MQDISEQLVDIVTRKTADFFNRAHPDEMSSWVEMDEVAHEEARQITRVILANFLEVLATPLNQAIVTSTAFFDEEEVSTDETAERPANSDLDAGAPDDGVLLLLEQEVDGDVPKKVRGLAN